MSDDNTTKVNSELPDEEALGAFAASAFAAPRRGRRNKQQAGEPSSTEKTAEEGKEAPAPQAAPAPSAAPREEPAAPSPQPASAPAPQPAPQVASIPAPAIPETPAAATQAQLEVRPSPQPPAHTPTPAVAPTAAGEVQIPNLGSSGSRATQCTIMVSTSVRDRIAQYQLTKKMEAGKEPTNSVVVRRAFLHAKRGDLFRKLLSAVHHRQNPVEDEDYDDDGLLGEVVGRRAERGRMKDSQQQSFRPSYQELATYDAFSTAYGFPSRSDFLDACLDEFLPAMPSGGRRGR